MDNLDFSEEEIQEQLAILGYKNIPKHRLLEFKQDLEELVRHEEWKSLASSTQINSDKSQVATSQPSPPAYTKEKVSRQCYFKGSGEGFFLHTGQPGNGRQVLITQVPCDSYAQHSVALKLQLPPGAPSRLHVELDPDPDDTLDPPLTDSYISTPDSHRGRFIKRKVLRKHKGQSLVCDESVYSEDSALCLHRSHTSAGVQVANMYKTYGSQWDRESEGDDNSLNSSFWSDGERQEDEDEVKIEGVISKEDSKTVGNAEDTYQKASEEEEVGRERVIAEEGSKPVSGSEGSYQEEKIERLVVKEERKPVADSEECQDETSEEEGLSEEESKAVGDGDDSYTDSSEEEEEEEEVGRVISEEDSKSVADSEGSYTEASEEEVENSEEDSKPVGDTENSYTEASDEEEEETEQVCGKEEPKPVDDTEDSYAEASDEEEEETEQVIGEEDAKTVGDSEGYDHEASEEEEEEEENDVEDSKSVGNTKDFSQEASEEEEEENNEEESKPSGDAEDFNTEASEEEETERANGEEDSKHGSNSEDSFQEASKEEEEEEMGEEDSHHVEDAGDSYQEASEEEKPELNDQVNISRESLEGGSKDDNDDEEEEEESCSSSSDSPAPSLMTSGYGTYRPEEVEGGDYRDDHTITEFDQDSRGDLSETREDEEEDSRSLCSFSGFDIEATEPDYHETRPLSMLANTKPEANVLCRNDDLRIKEDDAEVKLEDEDQSDEEKLKALHAASEKKVTSPTSEEQRCITVAEDTLDWKPLEGGSDDVGGGKLCERLEEEKLDLKEENKEKEVEDKGELEEPDESSSNKDIKFIDSKVDFSQMTYDKMCEEWEGNLRQKKDAASCLEERLADLHLSSPAQRNFETENEDVTSQSDTQSSETEGVSFSAFESYMRGMTRAQSDGDLRPKPKSFIRPVMSQQTIKKTDPVAKYFQYKQLWEMFKLPGEKDRRALRLEIKERLAYQPPPPKPRRVYVPNTYIVPTEKKRSALRWEIRNDLANGVLPHKFSYRF